MALPKNSTKDLREKMIPNLHKLFQKLEEEGTCLKLT